MENKEIYIDGVDVSGCENYIGANTKTHNCTLYDGYLRPCKNADCYYKQLKRKEQECDMWKNLTVDNGAVALKYQQQLDQLKAENEDLKIYIESNEQQVKEVETLVMDNDRLINELDQLEEQLEAYKMEAEEGKEINAELKAENEELRNKLSESLMFRFISQDEEIIKLKKENEKLTQELYGQEKIINRLIKQVDNQKQTLAEIKEIAEIKQKQSVFVGETVFEQILQKINEVDNE